MGTYRNTAPRPSNFGSPCAPQRVAIVTYACVVSSFGILCLLAGAVWGVKYYNEQLVECKAVRLNSFLLYYLRDCAFEEHYVKNILILFAKLHVGFPETLKKTIN